MRKIVQVSVAILLLAGGFVWGFAAHRNHLFPYWSIQSLARSAWVRATAHRVGLEDELPSSQLERREVVPQRASRAARHERSLRALPYVSGTVDPNRERRGVILREPGQASPGVNLYGPETEPAAYLVDMAGKVLYRWRSAGEPWQHRELLPDGSLLVTEIDQAVIKLDRDSKVLWRRRGRFHHDLWVTDDGRIYTLTEEPRSVPAIHERNDTFVDCVTILSSEGEILERISILDVLLDSPYSFVLTRADHLEIDPEAGPLDPVHANHVEVFDGSLADRSPLFQRGDVLLSLRNPSVIVILDARSREMPGAWGAKTSSTSTSPPCSRMATCWCSTTASIGRGSWSSTPRAGGSSGATPTEISSRNPEGASSVSPTATP